MNARLRTLGGLALLVDGQELAAFSAQRLRCALLTYLAVERTASRDQLLSIFWPDREPDRGRRAFSQLLYEIRRDVGADLLDTQGEQVVARLGVDALEFEAAVGLGELGSAVAMYGGPFLDTFRLPDHGAFEHWADRQRSRFERLYRKAQRGLIESHAAQGDLASALEAARTWAAIEPLEDEAHHRMIELLAATGRRSEALVEYDAYRDRVRRELEVEPLEETEGLVARIRGAGFETRPLRPLVSEPDAAGASTTEIGRTGAGASRTSSDDLTDHPASSVGTKDPARPDGTSTPTARPRRWQGAAVAAGVAALAVALAALLYGPAPRCPNGSQPPCVDDAPPWQLLVLPFGGRSDTSIDGPLSARLLARSLDAWREAGVIDFLRVQDALAREGLVDADLRLDDGLRLGRKLGAHRVIMGEAIPLADSVMVSASIYAVSGERLGTARLSLSRIAPDLAAFDVLASTLLVGNAASLASGDSAPVSHSLRSLLAYQAGEAALADWNLEEAGRHFAASARSDSAFAPAYLRLAEVLSWAGDTSAVWRDAARRAALLSARLSDREASLARGLHALAERRYPEACSAFHDARAQDSLSFVAWYGIGDCNAWDPIVLPDPDSPTGWSFRSSYHAAIAAYRRALEIVPSFNFAFRSTAYERLTQLVRTEATAPLHGVLADNSMQFAAHPSLDDTIAFWPVPLGDFMSGREPGAGEASWIAAIDYNRRQLRQIVEAWVEAFPRNGDAVEAHALVLENAGAIEGADHPSALDIARKALRLDTDPARRIRLRVMEVRLLVKRQEYAAARRLAHEVLADRPAIVDSNAAWLLSGLAALVGRPHLAAELWAKPATEHAAMFSVDLGFATPPALHRALLRVQVYGELDAFRDSTRSIWAWIAREVYDRGGVPDRRDAHMILLDVPASIAFRHTGATRRHGRSDFILIRMQNALAQDDTVGLRLVMEEVARYRNASPPAEFSPFLTREQVDAYLALGDTTQAARMLDDVMASIPALQPLMWTAVDAFALVEMMIARADLAYARGDRAIATRWAQAVIDLWSDADETLRDDVDRMRRVTR